MAAFVFCVAAFGLGGSRKGRAREPERHCPQRSGRIPEGRGRGLGGKSYKKNFYPEFARLGRGGAHQKGNLLERFVPLPDTLKYTFLNRRAHTGQGFCKEKLRIEQRLSGERLIRSHFSSPRAENAAFGWALLGSGILNVGFGMGQERGAPRGLLFSPGTQTT